MKEELGGWNNIIDFGDQRGGIPNRKLEPHLILGSLLTPHVTNLRELGVEVDVELEPGVQEFS